AAVDAPSGQRQPGAYRCLERAKRAGYPGAPAGAHRAGGGTEDAAGPGNDVQGKRGPAPGTSTSGRIALRTGIDPGDVAKTTNFGAAPGNHRVGGRLAAARAGSCRAR